MHESEFVDILPKITVDEKKRSSILSEYFEKQNVVLVGVL